MIEALLRARGRVTRIRVRYRTRFRIKTRTSLGRIRVRVRVMVRVRIRVRLRIFCIVKFDLVNLRSSESCFVYTKVGARSKGLHSLASEVKPVSEETWEI